MRCAATLLMLLLASVVAGCGSEGASAKAARDMLVDDWTGAHDAVPHVKWRGAAARLKGTLIDGEPSCAAAGASRFRCRFRVTRPKPPLSARVVAVVTFSGTGSVERWDIESIR
jgi:hypothetical protein